jgi:hypothetical protein
MKKLAFCLFLAAAISGCANDAPLQVGNSKYTIYRPGNEFARSKAVEEAQAFCRQKGKSYAEIVRNTDGETTFFCMNPGDTITYPTTPKVCVGVSNC